MKNVYYINNVIKFGINVIEYYFLNSVNSNKKILRVEKYNIYDNEGQFIEEEFRIFDSLEFNICNNVTYNTGEGHFLVINNKISKDKYIKNFFTGYDLVDQNEFNAIVKKIQMLS